MKSTLRRLLPPAAWSGRPIFSLPLFSRAPAWALLPTSCRSSYVINFAIRSGCDLPRHHSSKPAHKAREKVTEQKEGEEWVDPPHIEDAKQRLRDFEDLYQLLGVSPEAEREVIIVAYNERGAALASAPDFSSNDELKVQLQRLKHATEVLLDPPQRFEFDARRRSVHEALHRLEVDPKWVRGKQRMATVGRTFLFTKQAWAFGVFAVMMAAFTYIAVEFTRRKEEQLKRYDRPTTTKEHTQEALPRAAKRRVD